MAQLSDYRPIRKKVYVGSEGDADFFFHVRALSLNDIEELISRYAEDMNDLIETYNRVAAGKADGIAMEGFMSGALKSFPELMTEIIVCASDDTGEGAVENARRLPLPVQVDALMMIYGLTFGANGGVVKFVSQISGIWQAMKTTRSQNSA